MALAVASGAPHHFIIKHEVLVTHKTYRSPNNLLLSLLSVPEWRCANSRGRCFTDKAATSAACAPVEISSSSWSLTATHQSRDSYTEAQTQPAEHLQHVQRHGFTDSHMAYSTPTSDHHHQQQQRTQERTQLAPRCQTQQLRRPDPCPQQQQRRQQQPDQDLLLPLTGHSSSAARQQHPQLLPHPFCTLDHRTLTHRIKQCSSWHDAAVLFAQQSQCMNHINYAALITHLAQLGTSVRQKPVNWKPFISQVLAASEAHLNHCGPRQLSNMAWGLATLGFSDWINPDYPWTTVWQQQLQQQLHTASCRDTSNVLWAVATAVSKSRADSSSSGGWPLSSSITSSRPGQQPLVLQQQQHLLCDVRFQQELLSALHRELPNSSPQDVSNTLWALAALNLRPSAELQQYLFIRVQYHSSSLKPREVAQTLWALTQLRVQPPSEWFRELLLKQISHPAGLVIKQQQEQQQGDKVSSDLWHIVKPGDGLPERRQQWRRQRQQHRQQQRKLQRQRLQNRRSPVQNARQVRVETCSRVLQHESIVSNKSSSDSSLQTRQQPAAAADADFIADDGDRGSAAHSADFQQQSRVRYNNQQRQQQQRQQRGVLHESHPGNIIMCLVACAKLQQLPPDKWIDQVLTRLDQLLLLPRDSNNSSSSSSSSVAGMKQTATTVPGSSSSSSVNSGGFEPQDLANLIWALGSLGIKPHTAWIDRFLAASTKALPNAKPQELCNTIWGLARLNVAPNPTWLQGFDAASTACMHGFTAQGLADILVCQVALGLTPSGAWKEGWIAALKACWGSADAAAICKTLWAAAMLNLPLGKYWLVQAVVQAHGELQRALVNQEISSKELMNLVWAVGKLSRGSLHSSVSDLLGSHCCRAGAKMSWQQLVGVAQGLRKLKPLPAQRFVDYYCDLAESRVKYMPACQAAQVQAALLLLRAAADRAVVKRQQQQQQQQWQQQQVVLAWRQWQAQQQQSAAREAVLKSGEAEVQVGHQALSLVGV